MAYCRARTAANVGVLTVLLAIALSLFADIEDAVMLSRPRKQVRLQHERDSTLTEELGIVEVKDSSTELLHSAWQEQAAKLRQKRQETSSSAGLLHTSTSHLWGLRSSKVAVEGLATVSQVAKAGREGDLNWEVDIVHPSPFPPPLSPPPPPPPSPPPPPPAPPSSPPPPPRPPPVPPPPPHPPPPPPRPPKSPRAPPRYVLAINTLELPSLKRRLREGTA
mmetsp:Transcript_17/g.42  ORF Transcript_17/g.42 Transcript_17/m.42 type:complete len:221 (-) Transcript_17:33-695(-)